VLGFVFPDHGDHVATTANSLHTRVAERGKPQGERPCYMVSVAQAPRL
jgi:hypothetical protein